jgi:hypothetical protein
VLVEAAYTTDKLACEKYGVSERTLRHWRREAADGLHPELSGLLAAKKDEYSREWAAELPVALRRSLHTITEMCRAIGADPQMLKNPIALEKVAGAMKICADVYYTGKFIDARLGREQGGADAADGTSDDGTSDYVN